MSDYSAEFTPELETELIEDSERMHEESEKAPAIPSGNEYKRANPPGSTESQLTPDPPKHDGSRDQREHG